MSKKKQPAVKKVKLSDDLVDRKNTLIDALAKLKVTHVEVRWQGSGDDGGIEEINARDEKQDTEIDLEKSAPVAITKVVEESIDSGRRKKDGTPIYIKVKKTVNETVSLHDALEGFTTDVWDHFQCVDFNNDGGRGELTIDVATRDVKFEHFYYTSSEELADEAML
jgi:hypothetical protein